MHDYKLYNYKYIWRNESGKKTRLHVYYRYIIFKYSSLCLFSILLKYLQRESFLNLYCEAEIYESINGFHCTKGEKAIEKKIVCKRRNTIEDKILLCILLSQKKNLLVFIYNIYLLILTLVGQFILWLYSVYFKRMLMFLRKATNNYFFLN